MDTKILMVYGAGSEVMLKGSNEVVVVERVILGDCDSISYQVISYLPERHPVQVNSFEVFPLQDKVEEQIIGFGSGVVKREVNVYVDKDNKLVGVDDDLVQPIVYQLTDEEVEKMTTKTPEQVEVEVEKPKPKRKPKAKKAVNDEKKTQKKENPIKED